MHFTKCTKCWYICCDKLTKKQNSNTFIQWNPSSVLIQLHLKDNLQNNRLHTGLILYMIWTKFAYMRLLNQYIDKSLKKNKVYVREHTYKKTVFFITIKELQYTEATKYFKLKTFSTYTVHEKSQWNCLNNQIIKKWTKEI